MFSYAFDFGLYKKIITFAKIMLDMIKFISTGISKLRKIFSAPEHPKNRAERRAAIREKRCSEWRKFNNSKR